MKMILVYMPVIHKGYLDFVMAHPDAQIFLWGNSLIAKEPRLKKEIRALSPEDVKTVLNAATGREIKIAEIGDLDNICASALPLILPDDALSHRLLNETLLSLGLRYWQFQPVFLRWDSHTASLPVAVIPDQVISKKALRYIIRKAKSEAELSSDWWRHVGAVLFDKRNMIYISSHNEHLPTEYAPYIDGDPRASFKKGLNIELSTAIHAEANVLAKAAKIGIATARLSLLVTTFPCPVCAKLIVACGISTVYYLEGYGVLDGERILRDAQVKIIQVV